MLESYRTSDAINLLWINLLWISEENHNRLTIILLSTMSVVPMDVHQVGECLKFNLGTTHIVLDMQGMDSLEEGFVRDTYRMRPNQFTVRNEALPSPTIP